MSNISSRGCWLLGEQSSDCDVGLVLKHEVQDHVAVLWINPGSCGAWWPWCFGPSTAMEQMKSLLTTAALALGLAVPAIAQDTLQRDPGARVPARCGLGCDQAGSGAGLHGHLAARGREQQGHP